MTKGIVINGAIGTKIEDCKFIDLDIAIEAINARDLRVLRSKILKTNKQQKC